MTPYLSGVLFYIKSQNSENGAKVYCIVLSLLVTVIADCVINWF